MRLFPPVSEKEALEWLKSEASNRWGADAIAALERSLTTLAQAMAAVSAAEVPEDVEP
jgi:hypothetical protein